MKLSFDFDSTLSRTDVQAFAKEMVQAGHEVWIVTSRFDNEHIIKNKWLHIKDQNQKLFRVAEECGIEPEHIHFTNMDLKANFLKDRGFTFHLDDDKIELWDLSMTGDDCAPVLVENQDWKDQCLLALQK